MAKAIQLDVPARDRGAELRRRLAKGKVEHAEAILEFIDLLEVLHQQNVLATLRGAVGAGGSLTTYISAAAAQRESVRSLRNLIVLSKAFSRIDPELLESAVNSIAVSLGELQKRPPGLFRLIRAWWSPPARHALLAAGLVLAGVGYSLAKHSHGGA